MTEYLLPFLLLLGVLIFIHELGHFLAARWCGVKVERFSLGFGPALLRKRVGETEYVLAALPLGGYVKMLGELPGEELLPEERHRAFNHRPPWQRIVIALAGPLMNFALPVVLVATLVMLGWPTPTSRVGGVVHGSAAERAGMLPGDRIVEVDGRPIWQWSELTEGLQQGGERVRLVIERGGQRLPLEVVRERAPFGELGALGLQQAVPAPVIAVTDPGSAAAAAGLETGDRVVAVAGQPVADLPALERALARASGPVELEVRRRAPAPEAASAAATAEEVLRTRLEIAAGASLSALGIAPLDFQVSGVNPATPARRAGIQPGDIPVRVDGQTVGSAVELIEAIRKSEGRPLELELRRAGRPVTVTLEAIPTPMPEGEQLETHYAIGVSLGAPMVGGETRDLVVRNPLRALWLGVERTADMTVAIVAGIGQMVRGAIGVRQLAGPIGIGEIAADTFRASWLQFFTFMALISVNLAILNLLPVPVLDGGTIVLTALEWLRGGPLPTRLRDFAQAVGLSVILVLMGFAFWNDLSRHWGSIVGFLRNLV
jgi:regulator of sigma E protease